MSCRVDITMTLPYFAKKKRKTRKNSNKPIECKYKISPLSNDNNKTKIKINRNHRNNNRVEARKRYSNFFLSSEMKKLCQFVHKICRIFLLQHTCLLY